MSGSNAFDCIVVGGGVAGVSAAVAASDRGWRTALLERGRVLGGMARSFPDDRFGGEMDCGQHVLMACCTEYRGLLRRLGTEKLAPLQRRLDALVVDEQGRSTRLREVRLPSPLHLLPAMSRMPWLSSADRAAAAYAVTRLNTVRDVSKLDGVSFADWLGVAARGPVRRALWDLVCVATCNLPTAELSAAVGAFVAREGFLRSGAAAVGVPTVGLSRLLAPAVDMLARSGGRVLLDTAVDAVLIGDRSLVGGVRLTDGSELRAPRVVVAGPAPLLARVAPEVASHRSLARWQSLPTSPIVNLHLRFDRRVLDATFLAVWDSPLQWLFSRSRLQGEAGADETVVCSLSAASDLVALSGEAILERLLPHLHLAQPASRRATLLGWRVTRERDATAALRPGTAALRPGPRTPVTGLAIAGAWTDTGWPITMESAARSGRIAVGHLASKSKVQPTPATPTATAVPLLMDVVS
ncbi:MAG TPA: hydroxysqualene dehydroxylase HpnE [Candidatus Dormibacteraeota bacterium]|jgi:squalene-associated FAD-dependent desaturase|nr:hydroxysqualene dehydroxylase HpnE [Candidatus Dormibacteraeota bacterium]